MKRKNSFEQKGKIMCNAVSWYGLGYVESRTGKKDEILFLSDAELKTAKGKKVSNPNGHGEILDYFKPSDKAVPTKGECTDLSSPANFPAPIAKAICAGKMTRSLESVDLAYLCGCLLSAQAAKKVEDHEGLWKAFKNKANRAKAWKD